MKLHGYLQDVLGNRTAAGLLRSLAKSPAEERTVRGLARDARTPVSSAARTVRSLEEKRCGSACPPTCANPNPICTLQCVPRCQCPRGKVIDKKKKKCVFPFQCFH